TTATEAETERRLRETGESGTDYPIPLPDMASAAEKSAALAAIHDHFPSDEKLGPQPDRGTISAPNVHEMFADAYAMEYGVHDARRLGDYLDELVQLKKEAFIAHHAHRSQLFPKGL